MEYKKSRDTLTSRLGTGPSVNQETIAKIHTLLTAFDPNALQTSVLYAHACDGKQLIL